MKNEVKKVLLLTIFLISTMFSFYNVQAFTTEIDPKNYITMPEVINISQDGIATGTIYLDPQVRDYKIFYQRIDLSDSQANAIVEKNKKVNEYIENVNNQVQENNSELTKLKQNYDDALKNGATEEELSKLQSEYDKLYKEYTDFHDKSEQELEKLEQEYFDLIPEYTSSWTETKNESNNVKMDMNGYEGTLHFILWVKIENGTNTYYDYSGYSTEINNSSSDDKKDDDEPATGEWTDFSKAVFHLEKSGVSKAVLEISGVDVLKDSRYDLFITNNPSKPNVSDDMDDIKIILSYDSTSKTLKSADSEKLAEYIESNQDLYATVLEINVLNSNIVTYGNKLERYAESKYSDAFSSTFISYSADQIVTNFTHAKVNNRKMQIKVGKITDKSILQKIKSEDVSGFSDLLKYAKSNSAIYDETVSADKDDFFAIEYSAGDMGKPENKLIQLNGLENKEYYYLYVKPDDENGKYISNEAVTLAQASTYDNGDWYLFFYGSSDFNWVNLGGSTSTSGGPVDDTTAKTILPNTGSNIIIFVTTMLFVGTGLVLYKKYKNYNY